MEIEVLSQGLEECQMVATCCSGGSGSARS